jgi:uncharacterized protein YndB with AHSA1/START domain
LKSDTVTNARTFAAPREDLFQAFSNPERLALWWGPEGFTNTFREFGLRPGGAWRFVMRGPDGAEYENVSEFLEVEEPGRIVFRHLEPVHRFLMTMTFTERAGKTGLKWEMRFESPQTPQLMEFLGGGDGPDFGRFEAHLKEYQGPHARATC